MGNGRKPGDDDDDDDAGAAVEDQVVAQGPRLTKCVPRAVT